MAVTLLDMLLNAGMITPNQCDEALQNRVFFGGRIGTNLIELGFIDEVVLARFLSKKLAVPCVDPGDLLDIAQEVVDLIPAELAIQHQIVPIRVENRRLFMAMADPLALAVIDELAFITGHVVKPLIAPEVRLVQALGHYYGFAISERYQRIFERLEAERREREQEELTREEERQAREEVQRKYEQAQRAREAEEQAHAAELRALAEAEAEELWRERMRRYSISEFSKSLANATHRRQIADTLMRFLGQEFRFGALFLIKEHIADGWRAACLGEPLAAFDHVKLPLLPSSVLGQVVASGKSWLGAVPETADNADFKGLFDQDNDDDVLVVPVVVDQRTVILLVAAGSRDANAHGQTIVEKLAHKAALAFGILISRDRILLN